MLGNGLVHEWLCVAWVVTFVVAQAAITNEVDDHIFVELLAIVVCNFRNAHACFWVVSIDMENRCLHRFGNIT